SGLSVVMGAVVAHVLRSRMSADQLRIFMTAVDYQMAHGLALVLLGLLLVQYPGARLLRWSGGLMFAGLLLFCGSLYLLLLFDQRGFGLITPFGGVALIAAWCLVPFEFLRRV
ncbi:MAG: DUF423 domain-containing protein, partial [Gammaproteobacteria bacterium]|nr:DUF423 domain-containing protein [Gammaproteobacteria bacterium]